jgi:nucleoside-diphosphate-sugar epimerase
MVGRGRAHPGRQFDIAIDNLAYNASDVQNALDALRGRVGRYILTSTCGVYRFVPNRTMPVREDDIDFDWNPPDGDPSSAASSYQSGKREAERVLRNQSEIPYTIIRPPIVFGPNDPTLRGYFYLQRLMDGQPIILTNGGVSSFRLAYSRDLASAYVLAAENEKATGRTYTIAQTDVITLRDLLDAAASALGVEVYSVAIPKDVIDASGLDYADPYGSMVNFLPSTQRAEDELGYRSTPYRQWIGETALWYRDHYRGAGSAGYERRGEELAFAAWYAQQTANARDGWRRTG